MIRPGHSVIIITDLIPELIVVINPKHLIQNVVSLGATKVTPNKNIRSTEPRMRECYFSDEKILKAHSKYSQVRKGMAKGDKLGK